MQSPSFEPSTVLSNVQFGLMGYLPLTEERFKEWRKQDQSKLIAWGDKSQPPPPTIKQFQIVEEFLLGKMLFVGDNHKKEKNRPFRGELIESVSALFEFGGNSTFENKTPWEWNVIFTFYPKYDALITLLYVTIPSISVDQLIFLRELKWYLPDENKSSKMILQKGNLPLTSFKDLFDKIFPDVQLTEEKIDTNCPFFSFMELRSIGPAEAVMPYPESAHRLSAAEHYGLFSGDEGYRLVSVGSTCTSSGAKTGYPSPLFDPKFQFSGRRHFAYHFSPTNCIGFMSSDLATKKGEWANWYSVNVTHVPTLSDYIRLASDVPCLSDGIPVLVEVCMLRYMVLVKIEREIRDSFHRPLHRRVLARVQGNTPLEQAISLIEELDLYQDSALWIIGGPYSDSLFNYLAIRTRIDRARQSLQLVESESIRTVLALSGMTLAFVIAVVGTLLTMQTVLALTGMTIVIVLALWWMRKVFTLSNKTIWIVIAVVVAMWVIRLFIIQNQPVAKGAHQEIVPTSQGSPPPPQIVQSSSNISSVLDKASAPIGERAPQAVAAQAAGSSPRAIDGSRSSFPTTAATSSAPLRRAQTDK